MATVTIDIDLPPGVTVTGSQRDGDGHGFEVAWPLRGRCRCDRCVGDRPGRVEPREVKRRHKVKLMTRPRAQRRAELLKGDGI